MSTLSRTSSAFLIGTLVASAALPARAASSLTAYALSAAGESAVGAAGPPLSCATFGPDPLTAYFTSVVQVSLPTDGAACGVAADSRAATAKIGTVTVASNLAVGFGPAIDLKSYVGESEGRAGYGNLGVRAQGSYNGASNGFVVDGSQAFGRQTESMTFSGGVGAGRYRPTFTIDGSIVAVGRQDSELDFFYSVDAGPAFLGFRVRNSRSDVTFFTPAGLVSSLPGFTTTGGLATGLTTAGSTKVTFDIPITFGVAADITFALWAGVLPSSSVGLLTSSAGDVEFFSTARLTGIDVLDAGGVSLAAFGIASGSGTLYDRFGVVGTVAAVPEPESAALIAVGLVAVVALARRRKARSSAA